MLNWNSRPYLRGRPAGSPELAEGALFCEAHGEIRPVFDSGI